MFEENQPTQPVTQSAVAQTPVQQSSPQEPTDMFAQSETSNPVATSAGSASSPEQYMFEEEPDEKPWFLQKKVIFIALGSVLLLIVIIFGVQFALTYFKTQGVQTQPQTQTQQQPTPVQQQEQVPPVTPPITETQTTTPQLEQQGGQTVPLETQQQVSPIDSAPSDSTTPTAGVDTDGDGLTDAEETALGTDPTVTDTDKDGLTDREEVKVFFTDSRNPDTDSDGYLDGLEVKNGFNPNGEGKLPPLPGEAVQPVQ